MNHPEMFFIVSKNIAYSTPNSGGQATENVMLNLKEITDNSFSTFSLYQMKCFSNIKCNRKKVTQLTLT